MTSTASRRWLRYSLRTLLVVITAFSIWLGLRVNAARRQARAVAEIREQRKGSIYYDFELAGLGLPEAKSWVPRWILARTGPDLFHNVMSARLDHRDPRLQWEIDNNLHAGEPRDSARVAADVRRHLAALPRLRLLYLRVDPEASDECLAAVGALSNLKSLVCYSATDAGVAHLAYHRRLKSITMFDSKLTDESLRVFGTIPQLESLQATDNHFTDEGLAHLRKLTRLQTLDIDCGETRFTDAGLIHLECLQSLQSIYLQRTLVTPAGVAQLQRAIPSLRYSIVTPPPPYETQSGMDPFSTP